MKRRTRLVLSVVSGVAAAAIALLYTTSVRAEAAQAQQEALSRYGGELVQVCVALRDIEPGEEIDEGNIRVEEWVATLLPASAMTSLKDAVGKVATSRIPKRAPLSSAYFERREEGVEVPQGAVAVSVASNAEHAVGGALARGADVDVYASKDAVADRLCAARVLDTSVLSEGGGEVSWVTLAVDADAVQELLAAATRGMLTLTIPGGALAAGGGQTEGEGA